jgi:hypothetical protein
VTVTCPHCAEPTDTWPDLGGGEHQDYVEDCVVCCRPIRFVAIFDEHERDFAVEALAET